MRAATALSILCVLLAWPGPRPAPAGVIGSRHDLSVSGGGRTGMLGGDDVCLPCHAPHIAHPATPHWNRQLSSLLYTPYSSSTLQAEPGQPTSDSKLCLSCHDGTIGLGAVLSHGSSAPAAMTLPDRANLTTDLSDDHPISFRFDSGLASRDRELVDPSALPGHVRLDANGEMQCTTCHDAHSDTYPMFLVMDNAFSALCVTCHKKDGWSGSSHDSSAATWNGIGVNPWPHTDWNTVAANGCESCHTPHAAGSPQWLLTFPLEEDNCLSCHDGSVAKQDFRAEIRKLYGHPVQASLGLHDPVENFDLMPRHVECQDCHNPHATTERQAKPPYLSGALTNVAGVSSGGGRLERATYEYEVCFRCHADGGDVPAPAIRRDVFERSLRLKFDGANPSFHPVVDRGRNGDVPSLIFPMDESTQIYCTDCHNNDAGPGAGGVGPGGPHGSRWEFLLEREYRTADNTPESLQAYALCYKCHDRQSILGDRSFPEHRQHVAEENAPCSVCHDPHGIPGTQGGEANHTHLINFDTSIVLEDPETGLLRFEDLGSRRGRCYLECHGEAHSPEEY